MSYLNCIEVSGLHQWMDAGYVGTDLVPTTLCRFRRREQELEEMRVRVLEERIVVAEHGQPRMLPPPLPWDRDMEDELFPQTETPHVFQWVESLAS